jgi:hypothetical protein
MSWLRKGAAAAAALVVGSLALNHYERWDYYRLALRRARQLGRPLLVIGDPEKGMGSKLWVAYGHGDVCIDLRPTPGCTQCIEAEAVAFLKQQPTDSHVIFMSCVAEYVPSVTALMQEVYRVAGDWRNVWVVHTKWWAPASYVYDFEGDRSTNVLLTAPPDSPETQYKVLGAAGGQVHTVRP